MREWAIGGNKGADNTSAGDRGSEGTADRAERTQETRVGDCRQLGSKGVDDESAIDKTQAMGRE